LLGSASGVSPYAVENAGQGSEEDTEPVLPVEVLRTTLQKLGAKFQ
jgi:hypothetical protein